MGARTLRGAAEAAARPDYFALGRGTTGRGTGPGRGRRCSDSPLPAAIEASPNATRRVAGHAGRTAAAAGRRAGKGSGARANVAPRSVRLSTRNELYDLFPRGHVPQPHGAVLATAGQVFAVGGEVFDE